MRTFTYTSGVDASQVVDLNAPDGLLVGQIMELRTRTWDVDLGSRTLKSATRAARTAKATAVCRDMGLLDHACRVFDADLARLPVTGGRATAGTLDVDGWTQQAYAIRTEPDYVMPGLVRCEITFTLLDGVWRRDLPTGTFAPSEQGDYEYLDFPFDYPFDYGPPSAPPVVVVDGLDAMPFRMRVYGPCSDPVVTIGGNRYMLTGDIPAGAWVEISSVEGGRTVTLVTEGGDRLNWFAHAERGAGLGSGSYIFQPLPAGRSEVSWAGGFTFDLTPIEERSEPPWSPS